MMYELLHYLQLTVNLVLLSTAVFSLKGIDIELRVAIILASLILVAHTLTELTSIPYIYYSITGLLFSIVVLGILLALWARRTTYKENAADEPA